MTTRIFYDTEFIEDGRTIDLISIGMVADAECGCEYYAVSSEFDLDALAASPWLMQNVWPSIPKIHGDARMYALASAGPREGGWLRMHWPALDRRLRVRSLRAIIDWDHPRFRTRAQIADEVLHFIRKHGGRPELWAWYGAYDHVALCQLWGRMVNLPEAVPMFTCDLKQECERLGNPELPEQEDGNHDALADARHNLVRARFLDRLAGSGGR